MQLRHQCPKCRASLCQTLDSTDQQIACSWCDWSRSVTPTAWRDDGHPRACLLCGCEDLWRQKDFPQRLGLAMVVLAAVLSTIAWAYLWPLTALGILMGFALVDFVLYAVMPDVLVCYRCQARYRHLNPDASYPHFDLEVAERYRQEAQRMQRAANGR